MLFGGFDNKKSCYLFSPSTQQWTRLPNLPTERCFHKALKVKSKVFIVGGEYNNTIEEYEVSSKSLKFIATSRMSGRSLFGMCLLNDKMLLIAGGEDDNGIVTNNCVLFNTNYKQFMLFTYDQFKPLPSMNTERCGHVLVNVYGVIYSIGGENNKDEYLKSIEEFHPSTEEWRISTFELQIARCDHQAVAHKHFIYVFGGISNDGRTATIEKIDTVTKCVEIIPTQIRVTRSSFAVAKVNEKVHLLGGETGTFTNTDSVEIFDLNTEQIEQGGYMPFPNSGFSACVL